MNAAMGLPLTKRVSTSVLSPREAEMFKTLLSALVEVIL